jgi:hypothetical protein
VCSPYYFQQIASNAHKRHAHLHTQLAKLQQQFVEGKHTDVVIRVRIRGDAAAAKRQRTEGPASAGASTAADQYTDIPTHSLVLCARSAYFEKSLSGDWAEAAERRIELTVENEQELEDLKLLIKLSYSASYTHDGGQRLPHETRLRLVVRADALEFVEAVDQIIESLKLLPQEMGLEGAITCLTELPATLQTRPGMAARWSEAALQLTKHLGPVAGMFEAVAVGSLLDDQSLPLREDVKQLPVCALKALLASEALQLQSENEPYHLLCAWLQQSPHVTDSIQRAALFKELAPLLRYHHMTSDFLAAIVSQCPLMQASGLLPSVMGASHAHREALPSLLEERNVVRGRGNRGVALSAACWELKASFMLEEVAALEANELVWKWCGLVAGFAAALKVKREEDEDTLGVFLHICIPKPENALEAAPAVGVGIKWDVALSPDVVKPQLSHYFTKSYGWGYGNFFDKPWAESVCEGSPHFPGGKLEVKATVKLALEE